VVLDDQRMKVREIAETIGISKERVGCTLHEELDMKKLSARWVPRSLTGDLKHTHMKISEQCLEHFNKNKLVLCIGLLLWMRLGFTITHQNPNSSQKQWTEASCSAQKKTRWVSSAGKVMASLFWDTEGIWCIDYLEEGKTITGEYYSNLLTRLYEKIHEKRPSLQKKSSFIRTMHLPTKVFWQ
jgi:histone-lysine N-methyltransferase SETMAR